MPDICDLILDDHELFRRRFAELDELRARGADRGELARHWEPIAAKLELHAASEEELFYPMLLETGVRADDETTDAITDHNDIRDAVRRAARSEAGSESWWGAVLDARTANSDHMAEEERAAIPDARAHAAAGERDDLGTRWVAFTNDHAGGRDLEVVDKDAAEYVAQHH